MKNLPDSIFSLLRKWAVNTPCAPAIYHGTDGATTSFDQLERMVASAALRLQSDLPDITHGDAVAISGENGLEFAIFNLASMSLGWIPLPLMIRSHAGESAMAVVEQALGIKLHLYAKGFCESSVCGSGVSKREFTSYPPRSSSDSELNEWRNIAAQRPNDAIAYFNHTSGSSGAPKVVPAHDRELIANAIAIVAEIGIKSSSRTLCAFPFHFHDHLIRGLVSGCCSILYPTTLFAFRTSDLLLQSRATHFLTNPRGLAHLASESQVHLQRLAEWLKVIEIGGGAVSTDAAKRLRTEAQCDIRIVYGATETSGAALISPKEGSQNSRRLKALPGVEARIIDPDKDQVGELVFSGPTVATDYLGDPPGGTSLANGLFHSRDLAVRKPSGEFEILGRADNCAKIWGNKISLEPIETEIFDAFRGNVSLVQCLAVRVPDVNSLWDESLVVIVLLKEEVSNISRGKLRRIFSRTTLGAFVNLPRFLIFADSSEIRTSGGKVVRRTARQIFPTDIGTWDRSQRNRLRKIPLSARTILKGTRMIASTIASYTSLRKLFHYRLRKIP